MNIVTTANKEQLDVVMSFAQKGDYQQALLKGNLLMRQFPLDPILPNLVGTLYQSSGKGEAAISSFKQAIKLKPDFYQAYYNMAISLKDSDKHQDAIDANKKAIKLNPNYVAAHANMGLSLYALQRFEEAILSYEKSIKLNPNFYHVHENLGNALQEIDRCDDAIISYIKAIKLKPDNDAIYFSLGNALEKVGNHDGAIGSYIKGLRINPDNARAHLMLGFLQSEQYRPEEALASYRKSIELDPDYAESHLYLGKQLSKGKRYDEAIISYQKSIELNSDNDQVYFDLGYALIQTDRLNEALINFEQALKLNPDNTDIHMHMATIFNNLRNYEKVISSFKKGLENIAESKNFDRFSQSFFHLSILKDLDSNIEKMALNCQEELTQIYNKKIKNSRDFTFADYKSKGSSKKLRIGLVSGDLRKHPVGFFVKPLLQFIDREGYEICCFSNTIDKLEDDFTKELKSYAPEWYSIGDMDDAQAAKLIHEKNIDVLIDLSGHTTRSRLPMFSYRPAPVQAMWLGYWDTTGLKEIDYIIGDPYLLPEGVNHNFTEKLVHLEDCWICFEPPDIDFSISEPPAIKNGFITFGCFQKSVKVTKHTNMVWSEILKQVPRSKLLFKLNQKVIDTRSMILKDFTDNNIDSSRIIFQDPSPREKYFISYHDIDIALDTFPYPGLTVACDTLWMGVPIITKKGNSFLSNLGHTVAMNSDHSEFCASDDQEYIEKAVSLAQDIDKLNQERLARRDKLLASNLCDGPSFAKSFEKLMKKIILKERSD